MKKHSKKHNHTKAIILIAIALLGLYIISVKSTPMAGSSYGSMGTTMGINSLKERLKNLNAQLVSAAGARKRELQNQVNALQAEINRLQSGQSSSVMRPKS